jgi:hypothetical protein
MLVGVLLSFAASPAQAQVPFSEESLAAAVRVWELLWPAPAAS